MVKNNNNTLVCSIDLYYWNVNLTWSMAQGMRHGMSFLLPKICGKELLKDGAAWMAGKLIFPTWIMENTIALSMKVGHLNS